MSTSLSRLLFLGVVAALLPFSLACDDADPDSGRPRPTLNDDEPPVEVDAEALKAVFDCDVTVVAVGEPAEAELADAPCRFDDGRAMAYYAFGLDEAAALTVEAGSAWFDTVLYLYDHKGDPLGENDDIDPFNTNSRLTADLERGVYVAVVTSFEPEAAGFYRVAASR
jgi:hypothetical protein